MKALFKTFLFVSSSALLFTNCINSDKDLFDAEKAKELYEATFPVKNIDPNMDWSTTNSVSVAVGINEDYGTDYRVRIYDAYPLASNSNAKLIAEGTVNNEMSFNTTVDIPKALSTVYVVRTDEKNRHLVKVASVEDGQIKASFGASAVSTRSGDAGDFVVETHSVPYKDSDIADMLDKALEIGEGWNLGLNNSENLGEAPYTKDPMFNKDGSTRYFKITSPYTSTFTAGGNETMKILVDSKLTLSNYTQLSGTIEYIVTSKGEIEVNAGFVLTNTTNITVMPDGKVTGNNNITITNASNGKINYNGGEISISKFTISEKGYFYNSGKLTLDELIINNETTKLVNRGEAIIKNVTGYNSTVDNACKLTVTNFDGNLNVGPSTYTKIENYNPNHQNGRLIKMSKNSFLDITKTAKFNNTKTVGSSESPSLIKIEKVEGNYNKWDTRLSDNNIYWEINDATSRETISQTVAVGEFGSAPITIPAGECTGPGNTPNSGGTDLPEIDFQSYTYAFEDNYPHPGDYDFNDIVLDVTPSTVTNNKNQIQSYKLKVTLAAVGATKKLGAGIRITGLSKSDIDKVSFTDSKNMRGTLSGSAFENADMESGNEVVIPLFGDAHAALGANTTTRPMLNTGLASASTGTIEITIEPSNKTLTEPAFGKNKLDLFIAYQNKNETRTEIHIHEFAIDNGATPNGTVQIGRASCRERVASPRKFSSVAVLFKT